MGCAPVIIVVRRPLKISSFYGGQSEAYNCLVYHYFLISKMLQLIQNARHTRWEAGI
jgi:hypothetical protein